MGMQIDIDETATLEERQESVYLIDTTKDHIFAYEDGFVEVSYDYLQRVLPRLTELANKYKIEQDI